MSENSEVWDAYDQEPVRLRNGLVRITRIEALSRDSHLDTDELDEIGAEVVPYSPAHRLLSQGQPEIPALQAAPTDGLYNLQDRLSQPPIRSYRGPNQGRDKRRV